MPDAEQQTGPAAPSVPPEHPPRRRSGNGFALAALITGFLALVGALIPFVNYMSGLVALVAIALGSIAVLRSTQSRRPAITGIVVGVLALILSIVLAVSYTAGIMRVIEERNMRTAQLGTDRPAAVPLEARGTTSGPQTPTLPTASVRGSRDNPAPLGTPVRLSVNDVPQYEVTLGTSTLLANDVVAAASPVNSAPPAGMQYAMVPVTATYLGPGTGLPWIDVTVEFVSAAGTTHSTGDGPVVDPAPAFSSVAELYPGGSGTGIVVIAIPETDAALGTWAVSSVLADPHFYAAQ